MPSSFAYDLITMYDSPQTPRLILASGSPRRLELLTGASLDVKVVRPEVEEFRGGVYPPHELSQKNAVLKVEKVAADFPDDFVIASDTVVALEGCVYGKPKDLTEAAENLRKFRGRTHEVMTGVSIRRNEQAINFVETSLVKFREFDDSLIERYLSKVPVLDKAGGYAIQDHGDWLVEEIKGDYHNIMGLPLTMVLAKLVEMGFNPPATELF